MRTPIDVDISGRAAVIVFTRAEIRNPLSKDIIGRLHTVLDELAAAEIERVIFTGSGETFASGADLREIAGIEPEKAAEFALLGQSLMAKIAALPLLTIAAVNGHCFGGALDLALSCDIRIASRNARFAHPGANLGIITGWGGTQRLPRLIGQANALEIFFTAAPVDAEHAFAIGLINEIADNLIERALAVPQNPKRAL
ncbi:MAG: enoyl-CoA hydratase/isomerase family protein [Acidobacteria bacterium]|nr:enoyl-CoA hydratase/isomerase family protein [Acidobacteriota bacterium]